MCTQQDQFSFVYGDEAIAYYVIWKPDCKAEKILIKVHPTSEVIVTALEGTNPDEIHQAILKRARWIWQSLQEFKSHQELVQPKHYQSGDMMFYLGRRYMLKLLESEEQKPSVKLIRGQLQVNLKPQDRHNTALIKKLINAWYRSQSDRIFKDRLKQLVPQTQWVKTIPEIQTLAMQKQWGSCSIKGKILLNPHLIKASKECIDYVILHELCHLQEHNHSERFWRLLSRVMPNYSEVKAKLDSMAELYLSE
ncbi:M48 family metallopeptidase [Thiomicrorhabdus chilensis]|uniref:M48 family metallopeptidase n=1 Tax=Thiomicrorhabdus chilensis TaxID=63656 RepID=UPI000421ED67|nr:SprT family zinc-dependent metalloprotease [Thiomicrorhabdus chilensis]